MLRKFGWSEGEGLGKGQAGSVSHVKVSRKDDVMGIGYTSSVHETWTTQSVGFADVLDRIKRTSALPTTFTATGSDGEQEDEEEEDDHNKGEAEAVTSPSSPVGSRHFAMYAKRNALKTELLQSSSSQRVEEILGSASSSSSSARGGKRGRAEETKRGAPSDTASTSSTLRSPLLQRLMVRCVEHEPRATVTEDNVEVRTEDNVRVTKPKPRPPRCTDTPFLLPS